MDNKILDLAITFAGLYEVKPNAVWSDRKKSDQLLALLKPTGFQPGLPYCMFFAEAMWKATGQDVTGISGHVMTTYSKLKKQIVSDPLPGAIFFMRHGNTSNGHAGLVVSYDKVNKILTTIEGNTSASHALNVAQDRQGDGIYKKARRVSFQPNPNEMYFLGFLNPKNI